jgi:hypothetical protein
MLNWDTTLCLAPVSMDSNTYRENGHTYLSIFPETRKGVSAAQIIRVFVGRMAVTKL